MRVSLTERGLFLVALLFLANVVQAQPANSVPYLKIKSAAVKPGAVPGGAKAALTIVVTIAQGYHINANKPDDEMAIPTVLELNKPKQGSGVAFGTPIYPEPTALSVGYTDKPVKGYEGDIVIIVPVLTKATGKPQKLTLTGTLRAQGCNHTACFPPSRTPVAAAFQVTAGKKP